jgi:hypothetical protein
MVPLSSRPKLAELKSYVYALAGVSTTKALKLAQPDFGRFDFRRKSSWLTAQARLIQSCPDTQTFAQWLDEPPEEYRELFAEINTTASAFEQGIQVLRNASHEFRTAAEELELQAREASEVDALHRRN